MGAIGDVLERKEQASFVRFERRPVEDVVKSREQGIYVAKDVDFALITAPYSRDVFIAEWAEWIGQQERDCQAERIPRVWVDKYKAAYTAWKNGQELPLDGTPIKGWGMISPAQQETLIRMQILTVEIAAGMTDEAIKRIGMGGLDVKVKAKAWLAQNHDKGALTQEMAALAADNRNLQGSVESLQKQVQALMAAQGKTETEPAPYHVESNDITANDILDGDPVAAYTAKFGAPPHHRMKPETIIAKLKE